MARLGRLGGALLLETEGRYFLIGQTKMPVDYAAAGFEAPAERNALEVPYVALTVTGDAALGGPVLLLGVEGEAAAADLAKKLLIERNASVSDRLWGLVRRPSDDAKDPGDAPVDARWLGEIPLPLWSIVRDAVLRCV